MSKTPPELDKIADVCLNYRPKSIIPDIFKFLDDFELDFDTERVAESREGAD